MIDGASQIMFLTVDLHKRLVEAPAPMGIGPYMNDQLPADLGGKH